MNEENLSREQVATPQVLQLLKDQIEAEREECARVADTVAGRERDPFRAEVAQRIAAQIRARVNPPPRA